MSRLSFTLVVALGMVVASCDRDASEEAQESSTSVGGTSEILYDEVGDLMPATNLVDLDGRVLNLGALQGTPVLVNLWATWCAPCVKEMPLLDELAADYDGRLQVLTASQDLGGPAKVGPFFAERDFDFLEPWMDPEGELGEAIGGGVMPTTVLYDAMGTEVWRVYGDFDWASAEARAAIDKVTGD